MIGYVRSVPNIVSHSIYTYLMKIKTLNKDEKIVIKNPHRQKTSLIFIYFESQGLTSV